MTCVSRYRVIQLKMRLKVYECFSIQCLVHVFCKGLVHKQVLILQQSVKHTWINELLWKVPL